MSVNTIKVLSLDGGGSRGYLSNSFFQEFVQLWGINPEDIWKNFDVITGSSVGGITALAYAFGITPAQLEPFFLEEAPWIFTIRTAADVASGSINASLPSNRPNIAQKVGILALNDQFYTSVSPNSNYGSARLARGINSIFGTNTLQNLKTNTVIPTLQFDTKTFVTLSNLNYAEFSGQNELIANVALMTSAAPLYLPTLSIDGHQYMDGGIYENNATPLGLTLGKMLKPNANRYCVLSLGTGLGEYGFDAGPIVPGPSLPFQDAVTTTVQLLDIAITGAQEANSKNLFLESQYTLDNLFYYRFQPTLSTLYDTELDNTDPLYFKYLKQTAVDYFNDDIENIVTFLAHLTA